MKCEKCERENVDGAVYCAFCGTRLEGRSPIVTLPISAVASESESASPAPPPPPPPPPPGLPLPPPAQPQQLGVPYPHPPSAADERTSGMAVASLVLGILGFLTVGITSFFGLIFGIAGLVQISNSEGRLKGHGMAAAGTAISGVTLLMLPIMAAIIFPVFARAREKAQQSACISNEKQLALAALMYAQDYDQYEPMAANWADALYPYMRNTQLLICPSATDQTQQSYAYNQAIAQKPQATIRDPAQTVLLFDSQPGSNLAGGPDLIVDRHNNGANLALADGHVKWYRQGSGSSLIWDPGAALPPGANLPGFPGGLPGLHMPPAPTTPEAP